MSEPTIIEGEIVGVDVDNRTMRIAVYHTVPWATELRRAIIDAMRLDERVRVRIDGGVAYDIQPIEDQP